MPDQQYYQQHRERLLAATRAWKAANPDRARKHNREHMRRAQIRRKALEGRRANGRAWYAAHREQERERARQFRREHPEKVREYQARYRQRHPERVAEQSRRATRAWRDRNQDAVREKQRVTATQRREADPDAYSRWYQANLERERERGREASRLRSRLKKLGLPPRRIQRVYAADRRANAKASEAFFTRQRSHTERSRIRRELDAPSYSPPAKYAALDARSRIIADRRDLRTAASELQAELRAARARDLARVVLPAIRERIERRDGARLMAEVQMDSIARLQRGAPAYDVDAELRRRIDKQAAEQVAKAGGLDRTHSRVSRASFPDPATARPAVPPRTRQSHRSLTAGPGRSPGAER